jgi:hypothetical protein
LFPRGELGRTNFKGRKKFRGGYSRDGEGAIARIDAGECRRNLTEALARELENVGYQ